MSNNLHQFTIAKHLWERSGELVFACTTASIAVEGKNSLGGDKTKTSPGHLIPQK